MYGLLSHRSLKCFTVTGKVAEYSMICLSRGRKPMSCSMIGSNSGESNLSACSTQEGCAVTGVCVRHAGGDVCRQSNSLSVQGE